MSGNETSAARPHCSCIHVLAGLVRGAWERGYRTSSIDNIRNWKFSSLVPMLMKSSFFFSRESPNCIPRLVSHSYDNYNIYMYIILGDREDVSTS